MKLSIIVPAHNEKNSIEAVIKAVEDNVYVEHEIVVVNDCSVDNTVNIVARLVLEYKNIHLVQNNNGPSFGNALRTGFNNAKSDFVVPVMADLCDDPKTINIMYEKILNGFDIVCGSRYIKGGKRIGGPRLKAFFSFFVGLILYIFLGVPTHDIANSFKMYRKKVISRIQTDAKSSEISMEITLKAYFKGFKITEIPTVWKERTYGESKFSAFKTGPQYFKLYLHALINKIFKNGQ